MNDLHSATDQQRRLNRRLYLISVLAVVGLIILLIILFTRQNKSIAAERVTLIKQLKAGPVVQIVPVTASGTARQITVIGEARPFLEVTLYAKISGYLKSILVDKGDRVRKGELLGTVESPETDQAYLGALADAQNKERIWRRDSVLVQKQFVSQEEADQSLTTYHQALDYLAGEKALLQYENLVSPFDGTVTARYADPGALVQNAENAQTGALPLVTIAELNLLRVYVYVDQDDARYLKDGYPVDVGLDYNPNMQLHEHITRISGELDPKTRMMLAEIDVHNTNDTITPGSFVQVHINLPDQSKPVIPTQALISRGDKFFVAEIDSSGKAHFRPIRIGTNDGQDVQVMEGVSVGDSVLINVGSDVSEGEKVRTYK